MAAQVDPQEREADDRELRVPVGPRDERGQQLGAVHDPLERELDQCVRMALDPDHVQAVVERLRRIAVGDPACGLVGGEETEPDRKLTPEVTPTSGQETTAGSYEDAHGNRTILTTVPVGLFPVERGGLSRRFATSSGLP